jgi:hypothetical protein
MPRTAVASFETPALAEHVVRDLEAIGFPRNELRAVTEPTTFEVTGIMSFGRLEFETDLARELSRIGATKDESQMYLEGLRHGRALVFATGSQEQVESAAEIMNRHGAAEIAEMKGAQPRLPHVSESNMTPLGASTSQAGRISEPSGTAHFFVW